MRRDPKCLSDLMMQALGRPELINQVRARRVFEHWSDIAGETLAKKCVPSRFEAGTLWITVSGASWAQELRMHKRELLEKLNEHDPIFNELRFVVGKVEQSAETTTDQGKAEIKPEEVDVEFHVPEIEEVGRRALGKMKAASKRRDVEAD